MKRMCKINPEVVRIDTIYHLQGGQPDESLLEKYLGIPYSILGVKQ